MAFVTASFSMDMQYAFQFIVADMDYENSSLMMKEKQHNIELGLKIHAETLFSQLKKIAFVGLCLKVICVFKWLIYR